MHGTLKGNTWDSSGPTAHLDTIPTGFYNQMLWGLPGTGTPGLGPPYSSRGTSETNVFLLILNHHTVGVGSARLPLLPVSSWLLPYILTYRTSVQPLQVVLSNGGSII